MGRPKLPSKPKTNRATPQSGSTYKGLGMVLGVGERRVRQMVEEGKLPQPGPAGFNMATAVQCYIEAIRAGRDLPTLQEAKIEKLKVDKEIAQLELDEKRQTLMGVHHLAAILNRALSTMRQRILGAVNMLPEEKDELLLDLKKLYAAAFETVGDDGGGAGPAAKA